MKLKPLSSTLWYESWNITYENISAVMKPKVKYSTRHAIEGYWRTNLTHTKQLIAHTIREDIEK